MTKKSLITQGEPHMKFNIKVILLGGLALYAAQWVVSMVSGAVIHEGILTEVYEANAAFWRRNELMA